MQRQIRHSLVNAETLLELFQKKPTVTDGPNQFLFKYGAIRFQDVGFSYDGKKKTIQDFTFHAEPGQKVALIGETGGGKSTILKLLFRFYDVQEGKILIDDQDIKHVTLHSLRECIGVVPQDPVLFNDTIIDNVRYSRMGASDEEVMEACRGAAIHDQILTFAEGYQTKVGENGVKLSGGELQRIAIARIILKDPEIVLLDEATSAVDTETEAQIQQALQKLTKGRTTITIAHRLTTVTNSDIMVVIKGGEIVEQGSPHALLDAKGKFSELWLKQVGINPTPNNEQSADEKPATYSDTPKVRKRETETHCSEASSSSGKILRPTAPEFVPRTDSGPRYQGGTTSKGSSSSHDHTAATKQYKDDTSTSKTDDNMRKTPQKRKSPTEEIADPGHIGAGKIEDKKKRANLAQRRRNNKSDPSGSTPKPSQHVGRSHSTIFDGSDEAPATRVQSRHVSAPGAPLSNLTNVSEVTRPSRRRAQRWHQRKRQSTEVTLTTTSGEGSSTWSSDTLHPPTPVVRLPSVTDDIAATNVENATSASTGSVHFAPGS